MSWFINLSARGKLFLGFGLLWLLLALVLTVSYLGFRDITRFEQGLYDTHMARLLTVERFRGSISYIRSQLLDLPTNAPGPEQEETIRNIRRAGQQALEVLEKLVQGSNNPAELRRTQALQSLEEQSLRGRETVISLVTKGNTDEARRLTRGDQNDRYDKLFDAAGGLLQEGLATLQGAIGQNVREAEDRIRLMVSLGLMAFLLGMVAIFLLNRTMARPLGELSSLAQQIAAGDLTVQIPHQGRQDEVGLLANSFREMVGNLRASTADIVAAVRQLEKTAHEILTAVTQIASSSAETATAISQTTTTVDQVRQAAQLSSQKAQEVSASAQGVAQVSQRGNQAMDEVAQGMRGIQGRMDAIAQTIVLLSEHGQAIGGIVATVTDLADQSNLLAVNAAIEAAKAGEQGKGFAVVAQEIKSLAEQSKQATAQVRGILGEVQRATSAAVMATEQGSKAVEAGIRQSEQAHQAILALSESSGQAARHAMQIMVSGQEQALGMDQVAVAMENIKQAGTETAVSMKQTEGAAKRITDLGEKLKRLVEHYVT